MRLAGRVVASHFVGGIDRHVVADSALRAGPGEDSPVVAQLAAGDRFELLDDTLGWAWGYAGDERRVGYVESRALTA